MRVEPAIESLFSLFLSTSISPNILRGLPSTMVSTPALLCPPRIISFQKPQQQTPVGSSYPPSSSAFRVAAASRRTHLLKPIIVNCGSSSIFQNKEAMAMVALFGGGFSIALVGPASAAADLPLLTYSLQQLNEPSNALSLPTWAIHVSSVLEWITAIALVWQYGEKSGNESWKGLSWGMVPLLGGAFCACTWHFFYNSEALEVLVALQAALTVIGNATMCFAAFRIYKSSEGNSKKL